MSVMRAGRIRYSTRAEAPRAAWRERCDRSAPVGDGPSAPGLTGPLGVASHGLFSRTRVTPNRFLHSVRRCLSYGIASAATCAPPELVFRAVVRPAPPLALPAVPPPGREPAKATHRATAEGRIRVQAASEGRAD